jgi:hypothetical protein
MDLCSSDWVAAETRRARQTPYGNKFSHNKGRTALGEIELGLLCLDAGAVAIHVCFI